MVSIAHLATDLLAHFLHTHPLFVLCVVKEIPGNQHYVTVRLGNLLRCNVFHCDK